MLPKKIPHARISVFQYQSQWFGRGAVDERLENVANKLLYALDRSRVLDKDSELLRSLLADFAFLARDAQIRLVCFWEENESDLVGYFNKGMPWLKSKEHIVDRASATIESFESISLMSDHFQLNKYKEPKDGNYTSVSDEIRETARKADGILKTRQSMLRQALVNDRTYHSMIDTLSRGFVDIDATTKGSYRGPKTAKLSSVLELDSFKNWRSSDATQVLWVHGKAGTGQGSIAASAIEFLEKAREHGSIVTSFFCDQSDTMRRSLKGLLQMVVRQIIDFDQDLARHLLSDSRKSKGSEKQEYDPEETLKVPALWDALHKMARDLPGGSVYVTLYGLEQMAEESLSQFLLFMEETPDVHATNSDEENEPVKWLLLSRAGRPNIEKCLKEKALEINLDDAENSVHVSDDLRTHISISVDELALPSSLAYFVKRHIHSRAEDNWIYVALVIQELKNALASGHSQHADIRKLLESFPYGLTDMFEHVRKRVLDPQAQGYEYTKELLRCRILAYVSPTLRELAIMAGLPSEDHEDHDTLKAYVVRCGAFLEISGNDWDPDNNTVEWIDIAAQDHLQQYAKNDLSLELNDMQHGIIALRLMDYMYHSIEQQEAHLEKHGERDDTATGLDDDADPVMTEEGNDAVKSAQKSNGSGTGEQDVDTETEDTDNETSTTSNADDEDAGQRQDEELKYPARYWVEHAKRAPPDVLEEFDFNHTFWLEDSEARQKWWRSIEDVHTRPGHTKVSALHVAVILEFRSLVDYLLEHNSTSDIHKQDSLAFQPLYYACGGGNEEIINALLRAGSDIDFKDADKPTALYAASSNGHRDIVNTLLSRNADVDAASSEYGTALYAAVENAHNGIAELLLACKAKVNVICGPSRRALNIAAFMGNLEGVRILVKQGADVDPNEDYVYGSALGAAARRGHAAIAKYLLSHNWSPCHVMKTYGSFLSAAATYDHLAVLEILLENEARVLVLEHALQAAAQRGYASIVTAILHKSSTLPSSIRHQRAFTLASFYGRADVLKLLYDRGVDQAQLDEALYQATDNEHEETVKLLLEFGANPDAEGPT
ncbi:ankyrin [Clathrospora elynae]|uniref:Ankyrin n=1 Tax=Clathrospora elynae TaxID=706981 RepID=A0A6A5SPN5_9PLEO|nr:ankyrin [Clathrospora elynae]